MEARGERDQAASGGDLTDEQLDTSLHSDDTSFIGRQNNVSLIPIDSHMHGRDEHTRLVRPNTQELTSLQRSGGCARNQKNELCNMLTQPDIDSPVTVASLIDGTLFQKVAYATRTALLNRGAMYGRQLNTKHIILTSGH